MYSSYYKVKRDVKPSCIVPYTFRLKDEKDKWK